jgi:5'-3' exonuclease
VKQQEIFLKRMLKQSNEQLEKVRIKEFQEQHHKNLKQISLQKGFLIGEHNPLAANMAKEMKKYKMMEEKLVKKELTQITSFRNDIIK